MLPVSEKDIYEIITSKASYQQFFEVLTTDPIRRREFEDKVKLFLTGKDENNNPIDKRKFQDLINDIFGTKIDERAIEAYNEFASLIYDQEITEKLGSVLGISNDIQRKIMDFHSETIKNIESINSELIQLRHRSFKSLVLSG